MNTMDMTSAPSQANIPVGALALPNGSGIALYLINGDQNMVRMVCKKGDIGNWTTSGMGMPSASGLTGGIGGALDPRNNGNVYTFALEGDTIQCNYDGIWTGVDPLLGGLVPAVPLGVAPSGHEMSVFIIASDGNVWVCTGKESMSWSWVNYLLPVSQQTGESIAINMVVGVVGSPGYIPEMPSWVLVVIGEDGVVYMLADIANWEAIGTNLPELAAPIGVCYQQIPNIGGATIVTSVIDINNNIWQASSPNWEWAQLPSAKGLSPELGIGIVGCFSTPSTYVMSEDNSIWVYDGNVWTPLGSPLALTSAPVSLLYEFPAQTYAFVTDENGAIWCNARDAHTNVSFWKSVA